MSLDRNANTENRIRRNWQRLREGGATADVHVEAPLENTGSAIVLLLAANGGLENNSGSLQITLVFNEVPSGTIDGTNATFTLAHTPVAGTLLLFVNGLLMNEGGDYTLSTNTITFAAGAKPEAGDWMKATYLR